MLSVIALPAAVPQCGCGLEIGTGRHDSRVDHRPRWRRSRGSAARTTVQAKTFGRSAELTLLPASISRPRQIGLLRIHVYLNCPFLGSYNLLSRCEGCDNCLGTGER